ncbi:MAG TPA: flagellin [Firmicutes bacterium]|nr:flagellin [Bacillota bacterium]
MIINTNISALQAWRNLYATDNALSKSLERLSTGLRINRAADDAAGLTVSEKMRAQINGLNQAVRNAQDAISLLQTAEGGLNEIHSILQRMRELSVQAANTTNTNQDRFQIQKEINQLAEELTRIGNTTEFNTIKLLDGSFSGGFHIGASEGHTMSISVGDMRAEALKVVAERADWSAVPGSTNFNPDSSANTGIDNLVAGTYKVVVTATGVVTLQTEDGTQIGSGTLGDNATSVTVTVTNTGYLVDQTKTTVDLAVSDTDSATSTITTAAGTIQLYVLQKGQGISVLQEGDAESAISTIQSAIDRVSWERSKIGALQNRLEHVIANLQVQAENMAAANSRIRDVDMAAEMANFTKQQILMQAGTAMLAQANAKPQAILSLLR